MFSRILRFNNIRWNKLNTVIILFKLPGFRKWIDIEIINIIIFKIIDQQNNSSRSSISSISSSIVVVVVVVLIASHWVFYGKGFTNNSMEFSMDFQTNGIEKLQPLPIFALNGIIVMQNTSGIVTQILPDPDTGCLRDPVDVDRA